MQKLSSLLSIMDASASTKPDADNKSVYGFFFKVDSTSYSAIPLKQKSIKYTKIPDFDFDAKVSWPPHSYTLQPRLRRIIALDDDDIIKTNRSLKPSITAPPKIMAANYSNRKIVTITEDDEKDQQPKITREKRIVKSANRSVEADFKQKQSSNRTTSRLTSSSKYAKEIKSSAKTISAYNKKEVNVTQQNYRSKQITNLSAENVKTKKLKEKDSLRNTKIINPSSKISLSKNFVTSSESEKEFARIKHIFYENLKPNSATFKKPVEKPKVNKTVSLPKPKVTLLKEIHSNNKPLTVIHVPLDGKCQKRVKESVSESEVVDKVDCGIDTSDVILYKDMNMGTDPMPQTVHQMTQIEDFEINTFCKCESTMQKQEKEEAFDSLEIPNVTLTKDKCDPKEESVNFNFMSVPNLEVPSLKIAPHREEANCSDVSLCQSASYIISRATLTYTSRQKINIQVVGNNNEDVSSSQTPSPLDYPVSVVSVYKNELKNKNLNENVSSDDLCKKEDNRDEYINCLNELESFNCSYVKLMKPSDIISTIKINNGLLHSDYICEQFQRELNFIDSFFESLQYLESCSLSDKNYPESKVENFVNNSVLFDSTFDVKNSEYDNFLSKLENGANIDDTETMASKSLCLLNLLIRDEQRRAKNLLFVLKMREDALKDFTKSQILWLEKKKKHDNTDISTLKKKQRGALLKLQHECGEMQRMRKALLTLSEKRKAALMKTKKNIELKLKNNVDVDQIILGKRKLKRSTSTDRNTAPLKCFDLSSSGCDESTTSRPNSEVALLTGETLASMTNVTSAEKCVQTGDGPSPTLMDHTTDTAAENFVVVDGGYLNILFHNLTLPQIFSSGKQYEVNEEALKNIVNSSNNHYNNLNGSDVVDKLMDLIKNKDTDKSSSTPSTARSLLEEFDQYYKTLNEEDKSPNNIVEPESPTKILEDSGVQVEIRLESAGEQNKMELSPCSSDETCKPNDTDLVDRPFVCSSMVSVESQCGSQEPVGGSVVPTGPLPVPVGAAAPGDVQPPDVPTWLQTKSSASSVSDSESVSSQPLCQTVSSLSSLSSPVHCEAEELRRQQLAIEREIKALEQQQCRLLVVREIPDKPPPPYTPPTETRTPKLPKMFAPDENFEEKIRRHVVEKDESEESEAFDIFVKDYCEESMERHKQEQSDMPWDACNLLPQKPQVELEKIVQKTAADLKEVLTTVTPAAVSGVSSRRSDHIDDILFAEWRRCEPEWTTLHTDEAIVKNQIFESIFQKILNDTIDEYKKTVQCSLVTSD